MRETRIENRLKTQVEKLEGISLKFISPGWSGCPDRVVLLPGGKAIFIELKAPGKKAEPLQAYRISQLKDLGFEAYTINSLKGVEEFIRSLKEIRADAV
jgi:hypothetical protein